MSLGRFSLRCVIAWTGVLGLAASFAAIAAEPVGTTIWTDLPLAAGAQMPGGDVDCGFAGGSLLDSPFDGSCGPPGCFWFRAEALLWWTNGADTPPLVSTGIVGQPGTEILFGDDPINSGPRGGLRLRMGAWLDCQQTRGFEGSFFWLGNDGDGATFSDGVIGRPFIDAGTGQNSIQIVNLPGLLDGRVSVDTGSSLLGAEALLRHNLCCDCCNDFDACDCSRVGVRRDLLIGFRYLNFSDRITIREDLVPVDPIIVPGTELVLTDSFRAFNNFYGLKLGLALERYRGPWSLEARPQVSVGGLVREVQIRGNTTITIPGAPTQQASGGLYALSSNIGDHSSTQFAVVPELDFHVGYLIRPNLRLLAGYSLLLIPQVLRAGEQIDPVINTQLLPPGVPPVAGQHPAFLNNESDLWVQGLNLGLEWRF
jgi:hypothetical protein